MMMPRPTQTSSFYIPFHDMGDEMDLAMDLDMDLGMDPYEPMPWPVDSPPGPFLPPGRHRMDSTPSMASEFSNIHDLTHPQSRALYMHMDGMMSSSLDESYPFDDNGIMTPTPDHLMYHPYPEPHIMLPSQDKHFATQPPKGRELSLAAQSTHTLSPTLTEAALLPPSVLATTPGLPTTENTATQPTLSVNTATVEPETEAAGILPLDPNGLIPINSLDDLDSLEADLLLAQKDWGSVPDEYQEPPFGFFPGESPRLALTYVPPPPLPMPHPRRQIGLPQITNRSVVTTLSMYP
jgi:hypothetical protein